MEGALLGERAWGCRFSPLPWEDSDPDLSGGWLDLVGHDSVVTRANLKTTEAQTGTHLEPVCWKRVRLIIKSWL